MRLRQRTIIKLGLLIFCLLIFIPYLLHRLVDEDNAEKANELKKRIKTLAETWIEVKKLREEAQHFNSDIKGHDQAVLVPPFKDVIVGDGSHLVEADKQTVFTKNKLGNYEPNDDKTRPGPGERGEAVYNTMEEKSKADRSVQDYGFNMVVSDKISLDRTVPDTRMNECKHWHYPTKLPTASVILVFHNEGWSTLLRTIHSVINTSPPELLKEVVMVDDFSTKLDLKEKLDNYITRFNGKVKIYRNAERLGLIGTRTRGADLATGDVIVFLDAHCECNKNWLPPLLARILQNRKTMAVPIVDGIDWNNFRYHPTYTTNHHRGIFEWGFLYKESQVPQKELATRDHHSEPYRSPTHAGGLFAMDKKYFLELGGYDPGLQIWGGENFELSFKIWQCGGVIEWVPCSRVGHVYRNHMPYSFGKINSKIPVIQLNYMRVVEVWLDDEFKEYFYTREPGVRGYPVGDIEKQLKFKKDNNCKSFKWFMDNIAYEVYEKFPPPPLNLAWGEIQLQDGSECMDTRGSGVGGSPVGFSICHHFGGNQMFRLNVKGQLAVGERCILDSGGDTINVQFCPTEPTGPWEYKKDDGLIRHKTYNKCLEAGEDSDIHLKSCDSENSKQKWKFKEIRSW